MHGSRLEVLARFGEIETPTTADELRVGIRETISHPDDIACCQIASGIVSNQFEDEAIFGHYFAAINGLTTQEKAWLFTMAARGSDPSSSLHLCWILDQLTDLVPTGDTALDNAAKSVFATFLCGPAEDAMMPTEAAGACLTAVRGWAKFEATLPPEAADPTPEQRNWRLLAHLLLVYEHDDVVVGADEIWCALLLDRRETIVTLASIEGVTTQSSQESRQYALGRLIQDYPGTTAPTLRVGARAPGRGVSGPPPPWGQRRRLRHGHARTSRRRIHSSAPAHLYPRPGSRPLRSRGHPADPPSNSAVAPTAATALTRLQLRWPQAPRQHALRPLRISAGREGVDR